MNRGNIIERLMNGFVNEFKSGIIEHCPFFYVLGNHEYVCFETIDEAVNTFKKELEAYEICVIQNDVIEYGNSIICGGTGFAKYNEQYNADTLICAKQMMGNREYEIHESEKLEKKYFEALSIAEQRKVPLIVFSHYPVKDWLGSNINGMAYYFTGHTHQNTDM